MIDNDDDATSLGKLAHNLSRILESVLPTNQRTKAKEKWNKIHEHTERCNNKIIAGAFVVEFK